MRRSDEPEVESEADRPLGALYEARGALAIAAAVLALVTALALLGMAGVGVGFSSVRGVTAVAALAAWACSAGFGVHWALGAVDIQSLRQEWPALVVVSAMLLFAVGLTAAAAW